MILIKEVTSYLESLAPLSSQEEYDNCGLLTGDKNTEVKGVLISLDCIEATVKEAINTGSNLIIAHHPIIFKGLKKLNGDNYIQRTIIKAIKNDIAIYAIHTNLDNYRFGVNAEIGERIGLQNLEILVPKAGVLNKLACYIPHENVDEVAQALYAAGAGHIGDYSECSFQVGGRGTFKPGEESLPYEGEINQLSEVDEVRFEVLISSHHINGAIKAMIEAHPYEEVAYEIYPLKNLHQYEGSGMVGELKEPIDEKEFLSQIKNIFGCGVIKHTSLRGKPVQRVAFCGGSGSFLLGQAIKSKADVYITGDVKYHEFFDADDQIVLMDIGHYESERFTSDRLKHILKKKFPTFAVRLTEVITNPINYF